VSRPCPCCHVRPGECLTPVGDGALCLCWRCVHLVVEHGVALEEAAQADACACPPEDVYPRDELDGELDVAAAN